MAHLNQNHAVSIQRTAALMHDFFGLSVSQASVVQATQNGADLLQATVQAIGQAAVNSAALHADETGLRAHKKLHWLHVLATHTLIWMGYTLGVAPRRLRRWRYWRNFKESWCMAAGYPTKHCYASMPCATPTTCAS